MHKPPSPIHAPQSLSVKITDGLQTAAKGTLGVPLHHRCAASPASRALTVPFSLVFASILTPQTDSHGRPAKQTALRSLRPLGIVLLFVTFAAPLRAQPLRQVITGEEIRAAGLVRLGELIDLVDGWTVISLDGLRQRSSPLHGGLGGDAAWELWVDGHPVDFDVLGVRMLNRLPVLLQDVDSVEVVRGPASTRGPLAAEGRVHVHTRRPKRGIHGRLAYWTGNETGDPGPFKYIGNDGYNVDHLGPDIEVTGEGGRAWGGFRAQGLSRIHFPTYRAVRDRLQEQLPSSGGARTYPKTELLGAAVQMRWTGERGEHGLWGGVSELGDFLFLEPYLREVPARSLFARLGARGHLALAPDVRASYYTSATVNRLSEWSADVGIDPSLRVVTYRAGLEASGRMARLDGRLGAYVQHDVAEASVDLADPTYTVTTLYAAATHRHPGVEPSVTLQARLDGENVALQGLLAVALRRSGWTWTTWLAYDEHLFDDTHRLWRWTRRGYPLLDTLGVPYVLGEAYDEHRVLALETAVEVQRGTAWTASTGAFIRHYRRLTLEDRMLTHYDEAWRHFDGVTVLKDGAGGTVAGGYAGLRRRWGPRLRQHLFISVQHAIRGDRLFTEAWRSRPVLEARTRAAFRAAPTFTLYSSLAYRSGTRWPGLGGAERLSDGSYRDAVPAALVADVAATKWLWERRLRGTLGVRNVLGEAYRQHPLGGAFPLSLRVQVGVAL